MWSCAAPPEIVSGRRWCALGHLLLCVGRWAVCRQTATPHHLPSRVCPPTPPHLAPLSIRKRIPHSPVWSYRPPTCHFLLSPFSMSLFTDQLEYRHNHTSRSNSRSPVHRPIRNYTFPHDAESSTSIQDSSTPVEHKPGSQRRGDDIPHPSRLVRLSPHTLLPYLSLVLSPSKGPPTTTHLDACSGPQHSSHAPIRRSVKRVSVTHTTSSTQAHKPPHTAPITTHASAKSKSPIVP